MRRVLYSGDWMTGNEIQKNEKKNILSRRIYFAIIKYIIYFSIEYIIGEDFGEVFSLSKIQHSSLLLRFPNTSSCVLHMFALVC